MYIFVYNLKEILPKEIKNGYLWVIFFFNGALHVCFLKYLTLTCKFFVIDEKLILKNLFKGHNIKKKKLLK